jgi:cytochrome c oxidase cbb3-type subunit I/II
MTENQNGGREHPHRRLERHLGLFAILTTVAISIGGIVEISPMFSAKLGPQPLDGVTPYTPLEVAGRDIYVREGCYLCHSQMVRPMRAELLRYGEWTRAGEYAYDRPFQLGSRRIGPDLQRVGGKYPDAWHFEHLRDPRSTSPGSVMPAYPWLLEDRVAMQDVYASVRALEKLGVPYRNVTQETVAAAVRSQARAITNSLEGMEITTEPDREIVALIAYLQRLGLDGKAALARAAASDSAPTGPAMPPANPHAAPANPHGARAANPHGARPERARARPVGTMPGSAPSPQPGAGATP